MSAKSNSDIKVAVIGCGNWGKNLIRVFHQLGALYAVSDIDPQKAASLSQQYNVLSLSLAAVLEDSNVDAVVIATPSVTHEELATLSLKAQKHVYVEKPLALSTKSASALTKLAEEQSCLLMVGHLLQYHHAFNTLKHLNREGALGQLRYITAHRSNFGKFPSEHSVLWDYAPHDISMILALMGGLPSQVLASGGNHLHHTTLDTVCIHLQYPLNRQAHIFVSWLYPTKEQKLTVVGDKAIAIFEDSQPWDSKLKIIPYPNHWQDGLPHPATAEIQPYSLTPSEPLMHECQHFLDAIFTHTQPLTNGVEGTEVIMVLEAAVQALLAQQPVTLSPEPLTLNPPKIHKERKLIRKIPQPSL